MAIFEAPSYAMIAACFQDEEYLKVVVLDEEVRNFKSESHLLNRFLEIWVDYRQFSLCRYMLGISNFRESSADSKMVVQKFVDKGRSVAFPTDLVTVFDDAT